MLKSPPTASRPSRDASSTGGKRMSVAFKLGRCTSRALVVIDGKRRLAKWGVFVQLVDLSPHVTLLALEKISDGSAQRRIAQPVRGVRRCREKSTRKLVCALSAGLVTSEALGDAVIDRRVVARFEMKPRYVRPSPPIAAVVRRAISKAEGHADVFRAPPCYGQYRMPRHRAADRVKKI